MICICMLFLVSHSGKKTKKKTDFGSMVDLFYYSVVWMRENSVYPDCGVTGINVVYFVDTEILCHITV